MSHYGPGGYEVSGRGAGRKELRHLLGETQVRQRRELLRLARRLPARSPALRALEMKILMTDNVAARLG